MESNSTAITGKNTLVLNNAESFGVFNLIGNIEPEDNISVGLYHMDTRFVSKLQLLVDNRLPVRLSSNIRERNEMMQVDLCNPVRLIEGQIGLPEGVIYLRREGFLLEGAYFEKISISNFGQKKNHLSLSFEFDSDFKDIFEIRGMSRSKRGTQFAPEKTENGQIHLHYEGLDGVGRCSDFRFQPQPQKTGEKQVTYELNLDVNEQQEVFLSIFFEINNQPPAILDYKEAYNRIQVEWGEVYKLFANIRSSNELFNNWIDRSLVDLESLTSQTRDGAYPFAGVPWYNTIFGRDGIVTAYEALWAAPYISQGVLKVLAKRQARALDPGKDAEPGKILHETRSGEMSETNEVPFKDYYGSVDSTPLFIMLAGEYYSRTADLDTIREIWKNILAALKWMDAYGDPDGDGFLEYVHKAENGLINQGWKDSHDSISHADGRLADPPIALCEIQGYAYAAKNQAAILAEVLGEDEIAQNLRKEAQQLKKQFNERFWDEALQCFVLALDGQQQPCRVVSSNAGQCLFTGIVDKELAPKLVETLMKDHMFSGWGIRTLASGEVRYNPMSYHNGSVWPHDTALIAYGMMRYGFIEESTKLFSGLFDLACAVPSFRLPELFCGFARQDARPVGYPVACSPQAWAVASCFMLIQSMLGLEIKGLTREIHFNKPNLPPFMKTLHIRNIILDGEELNIEMIRHTEDVGVNIISKPKAWTITITK